MPKPIKHRMQDSAERNAECQKSLQKRFIKFWRKAQKKGWANPDIAAAVAALTVIAPDILAK